MRDDGAELKVRRYDARMVRPLSWDEEGVSACAFVTRAAVAGKRVDQLQVHAPDPETGTYHISTYLFKDMDNGTEPSLLLAWKVQDGNLGTKTGRGFYEWQGEDGQRIIRERDEQLMQQLAEDAAVEDADCKSE